MDKHTSDVGGNFWHLCDKNKRSFQKEKYMKIYADEEMCEEGENGKLSDVDVSGEGRYLQPHVDEDHTCDQVNIVHVITEVNH